MSEDPRTVEAFSPMLTRIYTPYGIPSAPVRPRPDQHAQDEAALGKASTPLQGRVRQAQPLEGRTPSFNAGQGASRGLASVQEAGAQHIRIGSILEDFQSTMQALGADETTQSEVLSYLNGVALQARKDKPEVPFIKQSLRTAANSLDQYITQALGSPSQVVREWVDALLMQPIDFHQDDVALPGSAVLSATATPASGQSSASPDSARIRQQIKQWMTQAQAADTPAEAQALLSQALDLAETTQQPELAGRLRLQLGRSLEDNGQLNEAQTHYQTAAAHFEESGQTRSQARSLAALGSVLERQGQLAEAAPQYEAALTLLAPDDKARSRLLNDMGALQLRLGQPQQAIESFQGAYQALEAMNEQTPQARADLFSNLGAAYRQNRELDQALKSYRLSLQAARDARSKTAYRHALQQTASLYVELDQPRQAMQALARLNRL